MLTISMNGDEAPVLVVKGTIAGADLHRFGDALEQAARIQADTVRVDLGGVESWSLVAQAMVLSTARRLARRGGRLVLSGASQALRDASVRMNVFDQVATDDVAS